MGMNFSDSESDISSCGGVGSHQLTITVEPKIKELKRANYTDDVNWLLPCFVFCLQFFFFVFFKNKVDCIY